MAKATRDNPLGIDDDRFGPVDQSACTRAASALNTREQYERDQRWCEAQQGVIDAMVKGTVPYAAPWEDKRFQALVTKALHQGGSWRREAEKLAVIREVFGGSK